MKCEHCGYNIQIEDRFCPYCGQPNPFAVQHQREMQRFSNEFLKTKEEVLEQSSRFNRRTVRITILAVLVAACAVMGFLCVRADDIRWMKMEKQAAAEAPKYRKALEDMMNERRYADVYYYMNRNQLSYADAFREYDAVYMSSADYAMFYEDLMTLIAKSHGGEAYAYYSEEELMENIARHITEIYDGMEENEYHPEEYTEEKKAYMSDLADTAVDLLVRYIPLTEEEAEQIPGMTMARLSVLLEDAYEQ